MEFIYGSYLLTISNFFSAEFYKKIVFFSGKKSENFRNGIEKQRFRGQRFRGVGVQGADLKPKRYEKPCYILSTEADTTKLHMGKFSRL